MALTNKLSAIGDAIREKTGKTELLTLDAMPLEIASITTGGGGAEVEPVELTGIQTGNFAGLFAKLYIDLFGDTVTTKDLTYAYEIFKGTDLEQIPFELNYKENSKLSTGAMFQNASDLKELPKINNLTTTSISNTFYGCYRIRKIPENYMPLSISTGNNSSAFANCHSLRKIPSDILSVELTTNSYNYSLYYTGFHSCYCLDEISDISVAKGTYSSNAFNNMLYRCGRLKKFTFAMNDDGTPKIAKWKTQTLDFNIYCGHTYSTGYILDYNSGITADKCVKDDATYQALKNDPDWYTSSKDYSRYNKTSAIETINSLPDTSAYLATVGGTNTIKFTGAAGAKTDGGAINTLTAEEIAVATAKGWTVSLS